MFPNKCGRMSHTITDKFTSSSSQNIIIFNVMLIGILYIIYNNKNKKNKEDLNDSGLMSFVIFSISATIFMNSFLIENINQILVDLSKGGMILGGLLGWHTWGPNAWGEQAAA